MSADATERLRALARDYSRGRLSFEAYRRQRTSLLDSLDPPRARASPVPWPRPMVWGGFLVAVGTIVIVLSWHRGQNMTIEHERGPGPSRPEPAAAPDRIQGLIAPLLSDPDWDDARIAAVNAALLEEGPRRIAARQQTEWFQRFAAEVRRHLQERRSQQGTLAALAVTIGLDPDAPGEPLRAPGR